MKRILFTALLLTSIAFAQKKDSTKKDSIYVLRLTQNEYNALMQKVGEGIQYEADHQKDNAMKQWGDFLQQKTEVPNKEGKK